jgi:hypothetical protein
MVMVDFSYAPFLSNNPDYWRRSLYDLNSKTYISQDSILFKSQYDNIAQTIKRIPVCYNKSNGDIYLSVYSGSDYNIFGTDTIASSENAVFHFDSNFNALNVIRMPYAPSVIRQRDTTLVLGTSIYANPNYVWMLSDTVNVFNNQRSFWITQSNLNFQNRNHSFMATDNWQTGLELRDIEISNNGSVYALGFHENDIIFPPTVVPALNRSWKHLSAFGKMDLGISTGLKDNKIDASKEIVVYPNPFNNQFTIQEIGKFEYQLYSVDGRLIVSGTASENTVVSTENLKSGPYILKVLTNQVVKSRKLIK